MVFIVNSAESCIVDSLFSTFILLASILPFVIVIFKVCLAIYSSFSSKEICANSNYIYWEDDDQDLVLEQQQMMQELMQMVSFPTKNMLNANSQCCICLMDYLPNDKIDVLDCSEL